MFFQNKEYFLLLTVAIFLIATFIFSIRWKDKVRKKFGDVQLIELLTSSFDKKKYVLKFWLLLTAIIFIILASADLRKPVEGEKKLRTGIDIMIALDVSKSMYSEDIKPSRLEKARQFLNLLIENIGDNRIGIVLFAGRSYLQMPLTSDMVAAKIFVANATPDAVPVQGTEIGSALQLCANALNTQEKKHKAILLISDGETHDSKADDILPQLEENGIVVHAIGIGTAKGSLIMEPGTNNFKTDINGNTIISRLNEELLISIANETGGNYTNLGNAENTLNALLNNLNTIEKKQIQTASSKQYITYYQVFLVIAMLLLLGEIFIKETKKVEV